MNSKKQFTNDILKESMTILENPVSTVCHEKVLSRQYLELSSNDKELVKNCVLLGINQVLIAIMSQDKKLYNTVISISVGERFPVDYIIQRYFEESLLLKIH